MQIEAAGPAIIRESVTLYGAVVPNAERVRNVSARYAGVVRTVHKQTGDIVRAGETLATVESNDSLQIYPVNAPIAGVVTLRNANVGEAVEAQSLFTVTDLSTVWVELSLFSNATAQVRMGQRVRVDAVNGPTSGVGEIAWISALGSAATQSKTARVVLDNRDRLWIPGLYVAADVTVAESQVALGVQSAAIQRMGSERVVFVADADTYVARRVSLGRSDGDTTEVIDGMRPGERYVSANSFVVKAEIEKAGTEHTD
jgi:cobalt-zinc-cadmium efflux system membrane fusion protein